MAKHDGSTAMHHRILELEHWVSEIALAAIALNQVGKDDEAELYRVIVKALQGRVNELVYDYGRPALDMFRMEHREGIKSEHFPPVDLFAILANPLDAPTLFSTAVGKAN